MNLLFLKYFDRNVGKFLNFFFRIINNIFELFHRDKDGIEVKKILLIKFWGIGNIIMIQPVMKGVRERYPDAKIYFLTLEINRDLLEENPYLDEIYTFDVGKLLGFLYSGLSIFFKLRREKIDVLLDFEQFSHLSIIFAYMIGAKHKVGLINKSEKRGYLYNMQVPFNSKQHMSKTFLDVARAIGVDIAEDSYIDLHVSDKGREEVQNFLKGKIRDNELLVGMHIGSSDNFPGRRWPKEYFAKLADILIERYDARIVFTGGKGEVSLIEETINFMRDEAINSGGKLSTSGLIALIESCALFFSNDTAPVHIASALNIPIVAFYGPNTPEIYGPTRENSLVFYKQLPCSPCITNFNARTSFCRIPVCIENITVEEVIESVEKKYKYMLDRKNSRRR